MIERVVEPQRDKRRGNLVKRVFNGIGTYFEFDRHKTSYFTELTAGASTYLSLSYIFVLNQIILSRAGMTPSAVLFATVVASAAATILMGLWAKLPFAVAPGLEMNGYFALIICGTLKLDWPQGLTVVLLSGIINVIFTRMQLRDNMVTAIPPGLKRALSACIGAFVISIALHIAGIIDYKNGMIDTSTITLDSFTSYPALVMYIGAVTAIIRGQNIIDFPLNILAALVISFIMCIVWKIVPFMRCTIQKTCLQR